MEFLSDLGTSEVVTQIIHSHCECSWSCTATWQKSWVPCSVKWTSLSYLCYLHKAQTKVWVNW